MNENMNNISMLQCSAIALLLPPPGLMLEQRVVLTMLASLNSLCGCSVIGYQMLVARQMAAPRY